MLDTQPSDLTALNDRHLIVSNPGSCEGWGYHIGRFDLGRVEIDVADPMTHLSGPPGDPAPALSDPRWPTSCEACGYQFTANDMHMLVCTSVVRLPDGREVNYRDVPDGTTWEDMGDPSDFDYPFD